MIEGNRLTQEQVTRVIRKREHFPGRERDEREVQGYYAALAKAEWIAAGTIIISEQHVQTLHRLVMAGGRRVEQGFLLVADPAKKSRKYGLANEFRGLLR
jgi:Fic family protein